MYKPSTHTVIETYQDTLISHPTPGITQNTTVYREIADFVSDCNDETKASFYVGGRQQTRRENNQRIIEDDWGDLA